MSASNGLDGGLGLLALGAFGAIVLDHGIHAVTGDQAWGTRCRMRCLRLGRAKRVGWNVELRGFAVFLVVLALWTAGSRSAWAQENPLGDVKTPAPAPAEPMDNRPLVTGTDVGSKATTSPGAEIRVVVNLNCWCP